MPFLRGTRYAVQAAGAAVASAFTPASLPNLLYWANPNAGVFSDAGTTPAVATDPVRQWNDSSSGGRNASQATLGDRPIYESQSGSLMLDGSPAQTMALTSTLTIGTGAFCAYAVCHRASNVGTIVPMGYTVADHALLLQGTTAYLVAGSFVSASGVNDSGLMLLKWHRDAGGEAFFTATGLAQTSMGSFTNSISFDSLFYRPGGGNFTSGHLSHIIVEGSDITGTSHETSLLAYLLEQTGAAF